MSMSVLLLMKAETRRLEFHLSLNCVRNRNMEFNTSISCRPWGSAGL